MEFHKIPDKKYYVFTNDRDYSGLTVRKTKPIIKDSESKLYKIFQKTLVTLNKEELMEVYSESGTNHYQSYTGKTFYYIEIYNVVTWLKNKLGNGSKIYYDSINDYGEDNRYKENIAPKDLPDDATRVFKVIILNEDAELITKRTEKEKNFINISDGIKSDKKIYKHFIKPTLQSIFDEFGLRAGDECIYFESKDNLVKFIKKAIQEIIVKRFEDAGITATVDKQFGGTRSNYIYGTETIFQSKDFHIIEGGINEKILSE